MIAVTMNMITKYKKLNHCKIKDTVNAAEFISMTLKITDFARNPENHKELEALVAKYLFEKFLDDILKIWK